MTFFAHIFNSMLYVALGIVAAPAYITFGLGGGWWGVGVLAAGMTLNAWAQRYLRNRKFRPPKPARPKQAAKVVTRIKPVPVVAQTLKPPPHVEKHYPDFVRPLPPALSLLILRGADEEVEAHPRPTSSGRE